MANNILLNKLNRTSMQYERKFNIMEKPILYCYRVDEDTGKLDCYTVDD